MQTNEFRLGNLVYDDLGVVNEITALSLSCIVTEYEDGYQVNVNPKPIPLTEEWLLKFGFESCLPCDDFGDLKMPYYAKNGVLLFYNKNRTEHEKYDYLIGYGMMRSGKYHVVTFRWIKDVHILQNIYKDFVNEELTIKQ